MKVANETASRRVSFVELSGTLNRIFPYRRPRFQVPRFLSPGNRPLAANDLHGSRSGVFSDNGCETLAVLEVSPARAALRSLME